MHVSGHLGLIWTMRRIRTKYLPKLDNSQFNSIKSRELIKRLHLGDFISREQPFFQIQIASLGMIFILMGLIGGHGRICSKKWTLF